MINFYDTSSLLIKIPKEHFYISSVTIAELENIKTSGNKDYDIKVRARKVSNWLSENTDKYTMIRYSADVAAHLPVPEREASNDMKILATAIYLREDRNCEIKFFTNDNNLFLFCRELELAVEKIKEENYNYTGIYEINLADEELEDFYYHMDSNYFNLFVGQYAIIRNTDNEVVDIYCYDGVRMRPLHWDDIVCEGFTRLKPIKNDPYQACLFDSLQHNKVNMITGKAGSGKTLISISYLLSLLDRTIDRIVIFCNPVAANHASKLGYYPGTVEEKLLSTQIGHILTGKFGARDKVEQMIQNEQIVLIPAADARGYEVPPQSAVFITEAQNHDVELMKLLLQRCGDDTIVICEGDVEAQVDSDAYAGNNNGLRAMSKAFRGDSDFGQIDLKLIHRSHTAELAEKMGRD